MTNIFYTPTGNPATDSGGLSLVIRTEFLLIADGFAMVPQFITIGQYTSTFENVGDFTYILPPEPGTLALTSDVTTAVGAETARATAAETANTAAITAEAARATAAEAAEITNRNAAIAFETARAAAAEGALGTAIATEATRALAAEAAAQNNAIALSEVYASNAAGNAQTNAIAISEVYASNAAGNAQTNAIAISEASASATFLPLVGGSISGTLTVNGGTTQGSTGLFITSTSDALTPTAWGWSISVFCANGVSATGFMTVSDRRVKSEIRDITGAEGIDWIRRGRPRRYMMGGHPAAGFIAQEDVAAGRGEAVACIDDEADTFAESDGVAPAGKRLTRDYNHDIAYLTAALQNALHRIDALEQGHA